MSKRTMIVVAIAVAVLAASIAGLNWYRERQVVQAHMQLARSVALDAVHAGLSGDSKTLGRLFGRRLPEAELHTFKQLAPLRVMIDSRPMTPAYFNPGVRRNEATVHVIHPADLDWSVAVGLIDTGSGWRVSSMEATRPPK